MTVKQVWDAVLLLLDDPNTTEYDAYRLSFINRIQAELASEAVGYTLREPPPELKGESDELSTSELECRAVLIYGVAALLSTSAENKLTNYFEGKYAEGRQIARQNARVVYCDIKDVYGGAYGEQGF